ncbi:unnamed protein product [Effrenium voratum]|uniref:Uncharacterized protein n=1 Tax=Effrenium voratum TaxID=2562239 RepID=A0AA36N2P5_9DINO|nr:unnamed protein product [Effrenium voratum]
MVFVPGLPGLPGLPGATQKGGKKNTLVHRAQDVNIGIQTGRLGGEGRRHIHPKPSMEEGIGVHSQKGHYRDSEGRRYIPERDSLMAQKKENEARRT